MVDYSLLGLHTKPGTLLGGRTRSSRLTKDRYSTSNVSTSNVSDEDDYDGAMRRHRKLYDALVKKKKQPIDVQQYRYEERRDDETGSIPTTGVQTEVVAVAAPSDVKEKEKKILGKTVTLSRQVR